MNIERRMTPTSTMEFKQMKGSQRLAAIAGSALVFFVCFLGLTSQVNAVTILSASDSDPYYMGSVDPDGGSEATQAAQINVLNDLAINTTGPESDPDNDYDRSANTLCYPTCENATDEDAFKEDTSGDFTGNFGDGGVTGYTYLKAKYGTSAQVWYVAGLTGDFQLPSSTSDGGISHWVLFNPGGEVPEPGTLFLIGTGMVGIGYARRKGWLGSRG
jgi:hypothetical protein